MSLVTTLFTREGIVMAADSRLTLHQSLPSAGSNTPVQNLGVAQSDSTVKLFLTPGGVGISTYGAADIAGVPLTGFMDSFVLEGRTRTALAVQEEARSLLAFFRAMPNPPAAQFHVAGYDRGTGSPADPQVWHVDVAANSSNRVNPPGQQGAAWGGEADILYRILQPVWTRDSDGNYQPQPTFPVLWQFFTLQDAIDFAVFAIRTTTDTLRFLPRPKTVGGPIDVLVIRPGGAEWVARKGLHL